MQFTIFPTSGNLTKINTKYLQSVWDLGCNPLPNFGTDQLFFIWTLQGILCLLRTIGLRLPTDSISSVHDTTLQKVETVNYQAKSTNQGRAARIVVSPFLHWEVNIEPPTSGRVFVWAGAGQHLEIPLTCLDLIEVHSMAQLRAIGSIKDIYPPCPQLHFFISDIFVWPAELVKGNLAVRHEKWKESVQEETTEERKQMGGR